ncbi:sigma 54 modulation/S30EA ribosomal C-terminal domain-containing protein [Nocardia sp. NPDC055053]
MHRSTELATTNLQISVGRHVSAAATDYAHEKISAAMEYACEPVVSARVRLVGHPDPAVSDPIVAQANLNTGGNAVRAQVTAASTREAIDLLAARLRERLERLSRRWEPLRGNRFGPEPRVWHHGATPRPRLPYFPRPIEEREILRRKSFALANETCDEAANDMELLDYEFHLFTESGSRLDSVLYHRYDGHYGLITPAANAT